MKKILLPITIISLGVILRLMPHPANVAPITAIALFGGVYLDKKYAVFLPLFTMLISDAFLGFYPGLVTVYLSFILIGGMGLYIRNHKNITTVILGSLLSSVLFFLITNFNWWYIDALYPKTMQGLLSSYINALPFFRNTFLGDLIYTGIFFGGYEVSKRLVFKEKFLPQQAK
jgi:hypothetical protein